MRPGASPSPRERAHEAARHLGRAAPLDACARVSAVRDEGASGARKLVHPRRDDLVPLLRRRRRALRVPQDGGPLDGRESMTSGILLAAGLSMPRDVSTYGD